MRYRIEDLKGVPIDELASALGLPAHRSGASTVTRCINPSHDDRHPSMSLDTRRNRFKCFACGNSGSPVDLVMQVLTLDFPAAADWIGRAFALTCTDSDHPLTRTSPPINRRSQPPVSLPPSASSPTTTPRTIEILETLLAQLGPLSRVGAAYLESRGISLATATRARVVFIVSPGDIDRSLRARFPLEELTASGLYTTPDPRRQKLPVFRFFRHRLLFPILVDGRPVFLQGRRLDGDAKPKYLSAGGTVPAPYNADLLPTLSPGSRVLIAEGPIDALTLLDRGYPAVGIFGVQNFKPAWVSLFRDLEVVLVLDADDAGRKGTEKLAAIFATAGKPVRSVSLPEGTDVNTFFARRLAWTA